MHRAMWAAFCGTNWLAPIHEHTTGFNYNLPVSSPFLCKFLR